MFQSVYSYSSSRWLMQLSKCCWSINTVDYTRYIPLSPLIISPLTNLFQGFPGHSMYCSAFQGGDPSCWSYPNKKATSISYKSHGNDPLIFLGKIHHVPPFSMGFSKGFGGGPLYRTPCQGPHTAACSKRFSGHSPSFRWQPPAVLRCWGKPKMIQRRASLVGKAMESKGDTLWLCQNSY